MKKASDYDPEVLDLFNLYVHDKINRREFLDRVGKFAVGGLTAIAILKSLEPNYAEAQQTSWHDSRLSNTYVEFDSPNGHGKSSGLLSMPANHTGKLPGILVVHENRGLNPHIEDVARRAALEGFIAFAPDALAPIGGYPGNDADGRAMQGSMDGDKIFEDFVAASEFLRDHDHSTGKVGAVGFCFGGGVCNKLAARLSWFGASAPFYGRQVSEADTAKINAPLQIHYAGDDARINAGWPDYEAALKSHGKQYEMFMYEGCGHGFHNDSTPRYNEPAARLAWGRTIDFFRENLA